MKFSRSTLAIAAIIAIAVVFVHMIPMNYLGSWSNAQTNDIAHVLGFTALAFIAAHLGVPRLRAYLPSELRCYAAIAVLLVTLGLAAEAAQYFTSRDANAFDALRDVTGIGAGLSARWSLAAGSHRLAGILAAIAFIGLGLFQPVMVLVALRHSHSVFPLLADFESTLDLRIAQHLSVEAEIIAAPANWGSDGHVARLRPATRLSYRGLAFADMPRDWRDYSQLSFRASAVAETVLTVRINDMEHTGGFSDRFNRDIRIGPQPETIVIRLADVAAAPRNRELNLGDIERIAFYLDNRSEVFMLDDIRLE